MCNTYVRTYIYIYIYIIFMCVHMLMKEKRGGDTPRIRTGLGDQALGRFLYFCVSLVAWESVLSFFFFSPKAMPSVCFLFLFLSCFAFSLPSSLPPSLHACPHTIQGLGQYLDRLVQLPHASENPLIFEFLGLGMPQNGTRYELPKGKEREKARGCVCVCM